MTNRTKALIAGLAALVLSLGAVIVVLLTGSDEEPVAAPSTATETTSAPKQTDDALIKEDPKPHPTTAADRISAFGETYEWNTGISVSVGNVQPFEPAEWASFEPATAYVIYDVTVTNNGDKMHDIGMWYATVLSGGRQGGSVYDSEQGIEYPAGTLLPGQSITFSEAWGVEDPADLSVSVSPESGLYMPWVWQGGL